MKIAELIHDADHLTAPSNVDLWAAQTGAKTKRYDVFRGTYPEINSFDLLMLHGGAQHLWDTASDPWLLNELDFIRQTAGAGVPVIGFCLGCQLIAQAFGGRVFQSELELGLYPVVFHRSALGHPLLKGLESGLETFLWHMDHFELPTGFMTLAYTAAAPNQIISSPAAPAVGFQFHPEYTKENIHRYLENDEDGAWRTESGVLPTGKFLQEVARRPDRYGLFAQLMENAMDYLNTAFPGGERRRMASANPITN